MSVATVYLNEKEFFLPLILDTRVTFLHLTLVKYSIIFHKTKKGFNILCFAQFNEDYNTMSSLLWESFPDWLLLGPGEQVPHQLLLFTQVLDVHHGLCAIF